MALHYRQGRETKNGGTMRFSGRRSFCVRSDFDANRENRASYRAALKERSFGLYRPLSEGSRELLIAKLVPILREIEQTMDSYSVPRPKNLKSVGMPHVTFLEDNAVEKAILNGSVKNIELDYLHKGIAAFNERDLDGPRLAISDFEWAGNNRRKFAGRLALGAQMKFHEQTELVGKIMQTSGLSALDPLVPDHVTFYSYDASKNPSVARRQRTIIQSVMHQSFDNSFMSNVELGHLTTRLLDINEAA
jgi:hypothetical protein